MLIAPTPSLPMVTMAVICSPSVVIAPVHAPLLQPLREALGAERPAALVQHHGEGALGDAAVDAVVLLDLDQLEPAVRRDQLAVVGDVVLVGRAQPAHGDDDDAHGSRY